jgi:hypothetical protein
MKFISVEVLNNPKSPFDTFFPFTAAKSSQVVINVKYISLIEVDSNNPKDCCKITIADKVLWISLPFSKLEDLLVTKQGKVSVYI